MKYLVLVSYFVIAMANLYYAIGCYQHNKYVMSSFNGIAFLFMFYWAIEKSSKINKPPQNQKADD